MNNVHPLKNMEGIGRYMEGIGKPSRMAIFWHCTKIHFTCTFTVPTLKQFGQGIYMYVYTMMNVKSIRKTSVIKPHFGTEPKSVSQAPIAVPIAGTSIQ